MKKLFALVILIGTFNLVHAQYITVIKEYALKFQTPEELQKYNTESDLVYGWDNDNYAVDIEVVPFMESSYSNTSNSKNEAKEMAYDMGISDIQEGDYVSRIENAYYIIGKDEFDGALYPVIVLVIINSSQKQAFEITVDCYNMNLEKGIEIATSFSFTN